MPLFCLDVLFQRALPLRLLRDTLCEWASGWVFKLWPTGDEPLGGSSPSLSVSLPSSFPLDALGLHLVLTLSVQALPYVLFLGNTGCYTWSGN